MVQEFGFVRTVALSATNGIFLIVALFFGIRVAVFDPTDPVIYL